jgi:hypothetical protein
MSKIVSSEKNKPVRKMILSKHWQNIKGGSLFEWFRKAPVLF